MSAQDRVNPLIQLSSPKGEEFECKWIGNARSLTKKVGLFNFPKVKGTVGQDLDVTSDTYPLTLYFDSEDHDLDSDKFWEKLKENGKWEVVHPVYGVKFLQLLSASQEIQPVENQSHTVFNTQWMETLPDGSEFSISQLGAQVEAQGLLANAAAALQFVDNVRRDTFAQVAAVTSAVGKVVNAVKKTIRFVENFSIIPPQIEAIIRGIDSTIAATPLDTSALAGQVQSLIQTTVLAQDNVQGAIDNFFGFSSEIDDVQPEEADTEGANTASVQELALSAAMVAIGQSALLPGNETRTQAVETAEATLQFFTDMTNTLDESQTLYENEPIEFQFYSQSQSFSTNQRMAALAAQFLLLSAINLKVERRFILEVPRNFIEVCATEYGNIDDATLDFFIDTNKLKGNEIRIMPALKEVVVYV